MMASNSTYHEFSHVQSEPDNGYARPSSTWEAVSPLEYGTYDNVNIEGQRHQGYLQPALMQEQIVSSSENSRPQTPPKQLSTPPAPQGHIDWRTPAKLVGYFGAGLGLAIGHHFYYWSLNGQPVNSTSQQEWAIRYGTAFAFLVKTFFAAAITTAYHQHIWTVFKRKALSVTAIDKTFSIMSNLMAFFSWELCRNLPLGTIMATVVWMMPLSALVTPATLRVVTHSEVETMNIMAPALNFSDTAAINSQTNIAIGTFGSPLLSRIFQATYSGAAVLPMTPVISNAPNATYEASFTGPMLQCRVLNDTEAEITSTLHDTIQSTLSAASRKTFVVYMAFEPSPMFIDSDGQANSTFDYDTFYDHCISGSNTADRMCGNGVGNAGTNRTNGFFWVATGNSSWACHAWNATFDATFTVGDSSQTVSVNTAVLSPLDTTTYNQFNSYLNTREVYDLIFTQMRNLLRGMIRTTAGSGGASGTQLFMEADNTSIAQTALLGAVDFPWLAETLDLPSDYFEDLRRTADFNLARNKTIGELVQELSMNVTLSFFSTSKTWTTGDNRVNTTAYIPRASNIYSYNWRDLALTYAIALLASLIGVLIGAYSLYANGVTHGTNFSAILQTTRNSTLDELSRGKELGTEPLDKGFGNVRLRFGVLHADTGYGNASRHIDPPHEAFGLPEEVYPIQRRPHGKA